MITKFKSRMMVKISASLKAKLIACFLVVIIIMSTISITIYVTLRSATDKMEGMAECTILANNIATICDSLDTSLSDYIIRKNQKGKTDLINDVSFVCDYIKQLKIRVIDPNGVVIVDQMGTLANTYKESIDKLIELREGKDTLSDSISDLINKKNEIIKFSGFMKDSVKQFIGEELNQQSISKEKLSRQTKLTGIILVVIIIVISFFSIIFTVIFSNKIANTISKVASFAHEISEGNLAVKKIEVHSKDEISVLANAFNKMVDSLRVLIGEISSSSQEVSQSSVSLMINSEQNSKAIELIAASINQVSVGATDQTHSCEKTVIVVSELYENNKNIDRDAQKVLETAESAIKAAYVGNEKMEILVKQIKVIEDKIIETQSVSEKLIAESVNIAKILEHIINISSQTDLLALNAAIEAARAAKSITAISKEIQNNSQALSSSMTLGVNEVKEGISIVGIARNSFDEIMKANSKVDLQIKNISKEIKDMVENIVTVEEMSKIILSSATQCLDVSRNVGCTVEEQLASIEEVSSSAALLSGMAEDLNNSISSFTI